MDSVDDFLSIENSRTATPLTTQLFDVVDGLNNPELLIMDDVATAKSPLDSPRIKIWDKYADEAGRQAGGRKISFYEEASVHAFGLETVGYGKDSALKYGYRVDRGLRHENDLYPSYEGDLHLGDGEFASLLNRHRTETRKASLKVGDFGCGRGRALKEITELPGVDREGSYGITGHSIDLVVPEIKDRVVQANAVHLKPKHSDPEEARVDVLLSLYGIIHYHPFNSSKIKPGRSFGILQGINLTQVGGLMLNEYSFQAGIVFKKLIELGVLENPQGFSPHFKTAACLNSQCFRLLRRPSFEEVRELLEIENGTYNLAYN